MKRSVVPIVVLMPLLCYLLLPAPTAGIATWTAQSSGTTGELFAVSAVPAAAARSSVVWAVGAGSAGGGPSIRRTTDGGATWTSQQPPTGALMLRGVVAVNAGVAWAVGDGGTIIHTTDGGNTWSSQATSAKANLRAVAAADSGTAVAVGDSVVLATSDGGATWTTTYRPSVSLFGVAVATATTWYAVGDGGTIVRTDTSGASWSVRTSTVTGTLRGAAHAPGTAVGWAVGDGGAILRTTDSGNSWTRQAIAGVTTNLHGVVAVTDQVAYVVGESGAVYVTGDGGKSWSDQSQSSVSKFSGVAAASTTAAWAVGTGGAVYATTDGICAASASSGAYALPYFTLDADEGLAWVIDSSDVAGDGAQRATPRILVLPDGTLRLLHSSGGSVAVLEGTDGVTWAAPATGATLPFDDPNKVGIVYMSDGRIRAVQADNSDSYWRSAISCDGRTFVMEAGKRYSAVTSDAGIASVPHPAPASGTQWRAYYVGDLHGSYDPSHYNNTRAAISTDDGWTWTSERDGTMTASHTGDPNVVAVSSGGYRLYYLNKGKIRVVDTADGTTFSFSPEPPVVVESSTSPIYDPVVVKLPDGTIRMYFAHCDADAPSGCDGATGGDSSYLRIGSAYAVTSTPTPSHTPTATATPAPGA